MRCSLSASRQRLPTCAVGSPRCEAQGELHEINAEVDWNIELGTIMRLAQGPGTGKALLFNNIKDYNKPTSRCRRIFGSGAQQLSPHRHDAGPAARHPSARTGQDRPHHPDRQHSAEDRRHRPVQGEHPQGRRHRSLRISRRRIGTGSTAAVISSLMAAASPRIPKPA